MQQQFNYFSISKFFFLLIIPSLSLLSQPDSSSGIKLSGFVSSEIFFDTRQIINSRDGDVILYPENIKLDDNGEDINDKFNFNLLSIQSRINAEIKGGRGLGAESKGVIEFDFVGTKNSLISLVRLRHAYIHLQWEKAELHIGQYWHPMRPTDCSPSTTSFGGGTPIAALSRNPQIRLKYKLHNYFSISAVILSQLNFTSPGPAGASSEYIRNSGMPDIQSIIEYKNTSLLIGVVAGYKTLLPQLTTISGYKASNKIGSYNLSMYLKATNDKFTFKAAGLYGTNLYNLAMLGGYAKASLPNPNNGDVKYTNFKTGSVWTEVYSNGDEWEYGIFAGITQNLGTINKIMGDVYTRDTNIDYIYRVSPRIVYRKNNLDTSIELVILSAAYGMSDEYGRIIDSKPVSSYRFLLSFRYNF